MKTIRVPTREDYEAFAGGFCHNLWRGLDDEWTCPACGRTKFELLRWTRHVSYTNRAVTPYEVGWFAALHTHHDHCGDFDPGFWLEGQWIHSPNRKFEPTVVCDQCNLIDGFVKRRLGLPADWSYSPAEIRQFITPTPHGNHVVDFAEARRIHDEDDIFAT